jgi:hypothetical protein
MAKEQFVIPPTDINDKIIQVEDTVVFGSPQSMELLIGIVKKINKKTVTIRHVDMREINGFKRILETMYQRSFDNVVVIN